MSTARKLEKEAVQHAKKMAEESARQKLLQNDIDMQFEKANARAERKMAFRRHMYTHKWRYVFWVAIAFVSIFTNGIPLLVAAALSFFTYKRN